MKTDYQVGEHCWIRVDLPYAHDEARHQLSEGVVLFSFSMAGAVGEFYVIKMCDHSHPHLEVRDALLMAPSPKEAFAFNGPSRFARRGQKTHTT